MQWKCICSSRRGNRVPQSARLSEGRGVQSLSGQCPNRPCNFLSGASLRYKAHCSRAKHTVEHCLREHWTWSTFDETNLLNMALWVPLGASTCEGSQNWPDELERNWLTGPFAGPAKPISQTRFTICQTWSGEFSVLRFLNGWETKPQIDTFQSTAPHSECCQVNRAVKWHLKDIIRNIGQPIRKVSCVFGTVLSILTWLVNDKGDLQSCTGKENNSYLSIRQTIE